MEDKRLEERKKFLDPVKDGRQQREKYMVDLRKKRKQDMFKKKRTLRMHEEVKGDIASGDGMLQTPEGMSFTATRDDYPSIKYEKYLKNLVPIIYETKPYVSTSYHKYT
jgi:hypothetical protein